MVTMGWLRSVGSIKLQVSLAEYSLFYRALLQKRPVIKSILLTVATPQRDLFICDTTHSYLTRLLYIGRDSCICDITPASKAPHAWTWGGYN